MTIELERARYGAAAWANLKGALPNPYPRTIGPNAIKYITAVIEDGFCTDTMGDFEKAFADAYGLKHCIATPGCTPALAALASAFRFEPGDEIIVSPITDYGSVMGITNQNYIPVFADTEPGTVNLSAQTIEKCITDRTRAILCVHKTGLICDMDPINELARKHGLIVYEDCCQSVFGEYKGRLAGTLSKASAFSFDSEKTMGSDMGGCLLTDDDELAERIRFMAHSRAAVIKPGFGRVHLEEGYAYRMALCTAAVTLAQLEIIRPNVRQRDKMARLITSLLSEIPGITPLPIPNSTTVYSAWMIGFSIDPEAFRCTTEEFAAQVEEEGIPGASMARYYLMPEALVYLQEKAAKKVYPYSMPPASREYHYGDETCPTAHKFLETFIRWCTFCEKYEPEHCEIAAEIVRRVADRNRA